ncbi:16S rRNA (adenine(1518)-N(6)/adenine(1519)-N(6))-dimethyltransferase RsmA [Candidatus Omnitrophota bacterium]
MLTLSTVRSILKEYNIRPSKRLGQSFLIDQNAKKKIIDSSDVCGEDTVLEIGPGLGALTEGLCRRAKRVIAIEKDKRLYEYLLHNNSFNNLELIRGDILKYKFGNEEGTRLKIVGNLPYYISSPILIHLLENRRFFTSLFVTVQKEFAERLTASPGNKTYGSISCFVQFYLEPSILFTVKKRAFHPVPQVDSSFLRLDVRRQGLYLTDEEKLFRIIKTCFGKRRKTMLNSLYSSKIFKSKEEVKKLLGDSGISETRRPETVSLKEFVDLVNAM